MPGWVWVLILSSLAASYPTFFLIVACIVACIVWPEFQFAAGVAVLFALVQIIIEGKEQKMFVRFCEPDKTIGWNRLFMAVKLEKTNE